MKFLTYMMALVVGILIGMLFSSCNDHIQTSDPCEEFLSERSSIIYHLHEGAISEKEGTDELVKVDEGINKFCPCKDSTKHLH